MKLNIDTVKALLASIEELPDYPAKGEIKIDGIDPVTVLYHLSLMLEAGLIKGNEYAEREGRSVFVDRLTREGHAFLANAQNEAVWERFNAVRQSVGSFSFDIAQSLLDTIAHQIALETCYNEE